MRTPTVRGTRGNLRDIKEGLMTSRKIRGLSVDRESQNTRKHFLESGCLETTRVDLGGGLPKWYRVRPWWKMEPLSKGG